MSNLNNVRNFCIIAHIDHGKSTLADRFIEMLVGFDRKNINKKQVLDSMELEQERGITIKLNTIRLNYKNNNKNYVFNLIDTPGHVDFHYEVSRSLKACEGAILVVDATQGVQAQTIANLMLAIESNLEIIPVINKVDLINADVEKVSKEIVDLIGGKAEDIISISAKTGQNVEKIFERIIEVIEPPKNEDLGYSRALICDSYYDTYRGAILLVRIFNGTFKVKDKIKLFHADKEFEITELGWKVLKEEPQKSLSAGEVGWIGASIKDPSVVKVGDSIVTTSSKNIKPLDGYKEILPNVFCGIFPIDGRDFEALKTAFSKIHLSDSSFIFSPEASEALGSGFRCGFLGLLHKEIIQERIEREFDIPVMPTIPSVLYHIYLTNGNKLETSNPSAFPIRDVIKEVHEPVMHVNVITLNNKIGDVMGLCKDKRGKFVDMKTIDQTKTQIEFMIPLSELIYDFFDLLKSLTSGYASFDYDFSHYEAAKLMKLDILLNREVIPPLSFIVETSQGHRKGKVICEKLKDIIPRQQFEIPIQASLGSAVVARETVKALRKNVTAKCYGGDVTRKMKLLEKQKKGKKKMKMFGKVALPPEAFAAVLKA